MLAGRWINIVGPEPDSYEAIAAHLRVNTEGRVHITDSGGTSSPTLKFNAKSGLVMIDATENNPGQAIEILQQCRGSGKKQLMYAFINADPNSRLEVLTGPPDINGIFYKGCDPELMAKGVLAMFNGDMWFPRRLIARYLSDQPGGNSNSFPVREHDLLTTREMEILHLLTTGAKNTDIASELSLSVHTIKTHIYHIYKKLDVENRTQAVNWATHNL